MNYRESPVSREYVKLRSGRATSVRMPGSPNPGPRDSVCQNRAEPEIGKPCAE